MLLLFSSSLPSRPNYSCSVNPSLLYLPNPRNEYRYKRPDKHQSILQFFPKFSQLEITLFSNFLYERNNHRDKKGGGSRDCLEDWRNTKVSSYDKAVYLIIGVCSSTFSRSFTSCPWTVVAFLQWLGEEEEEEASFVSSTYPLSPASLLWSPL